MSVSRRLPRWIALLAWMLVITYWSDQSSLPIDEPYIADLLGGFQHRLAHLVGFGGLALVARWAVDGWPRPNVIAVVIVGAFAAFDEWHQSFIPGRRAALDDWLFDVISALVVLAVLPRVRQVRWSPRLLARVVVACLLALVLALAALVQRQLA